MPVVTEHSRRSAGPIAREFQINDFGWRRSSLQGLKNSQVVDANRRRFGPLELSAPRETAPGVEVFWTYATECGNRRKIADRKPLRIKNLELEAPPGFEPGIEVLQTSALPLGDGAGRNCVQGDSGRVYARQQQHAEQQVGTIIE